MAASRRLTGRILSLLIIAVSLLSRGSLVVGGWTLDLLLLLNDELVTAVCQSFRF